MRFYLRQRPLLLCGERTRLSYLAGLTPPQQRALLSERGEAERRAADTSADTRRPAQTPGESRGKEKKKEKKTHMKGQHAYGSRWEAEGEGGEESWQPENEGGRERREV